MIDFIQEEEKVFNCETIAEAEWLDGEITNGPQLWYDVKTKDMLYILP